MRIMRVIINQAAKQPSNQQKTENSYEIGMLSGN